MPEEMLLPIMPTLILSVVKYTTRHCKTSLWLCSSTYNENWAWCQRQSHVHSYESSSVVQEANEVWNPGYKCHDTVGLIESAH